MNIRIADEENVVFVYRDLWLFEIFLRVVEQGSMSSAAADLHISRVAVSEAIKKLEQKMQTPLFIREAKGSSLNTAGDALLPKATQLCRQSDRFLNHLNQMKKESKNRFVVGTLFGEHSLQLSAAASKTDSCSLVPKAMNLTSSFAWLTSGKVDMALLSGPTSHDHELIRQPLFTEPRVALYKPDTPVSSVRLAELDTYEWLSIADSADPVSMAHWLCCDMRGEPPPRSGPALTEIADIIHWVRSEKAVFVTTLSLARLFTNCGIEAVPISDVSNWTVSLVGTLDNADEVRDKAKLFRSHGVSSDHRMAHENL